MNRLLSLLGVLLLLAFTLPLSTVAAETKPVKSLAELTPAERAEYDRLMKQLEATKSLSGNSPATPASTGAH